MCQHPNAQPEVAATGSGEITRTDCLRCGHEVHGIDGRYACPLCGWVNHWSEGHTPLPTRHDSNRK